jgi:glycosyltransferase involved in cell wall biosynthesis
MTNTKVHIKGNFTVLLAVYHGDDASQFDRALASIFENTLLPKSVLVVADGALTEQLERVLSEYARSQSILKIFRLKSNQGLSKALNAGLSLVDTEWVARADADDINRPDRFQKQSDMVKAMNGSVDLMGGAISEINRAGTLLSIRRPPTSHDAIVKFAARRNPFNHMTVWFRTEFAHRIGGYPNIHLKEDYALWAAMIERGARCVNLDDVLVDALTGEDMYKRRGGIRYALGEVKLQKHLHKAGLKSAHLAFVDAFSRATIFLAPVFIRKLIYINILRSK